MITIPAIDSANSIVVDANVIINLMRSDPTGSSLSLLALEGSTTYITDTVEADLQNRLTGTQFAVYLTWAYGNHAAGEVTLVSTGIPVGRNKGEESMLWAVENGFAGDGPHLMLSGDADARLMFGGLDTANTMEFANSLLLSGEINLARYYVLTAQLTVVAPHEVIGPDGANLAFVPGFRGTVNGVTVIVGKNGINVNGEFVGLLQTFEIDPQTGTVTVNGPDNCFGPEVPIAMWRIDPDLIPAADGFSDLEAERARIWMKAIELIEAGDLVLSYDAAGTLVPARVTRTFRNEVSHILDVHGLKVTPGHATLCGDGMFKGRHVPIIDILLSDGALVQADGTLVRMAINAPVGSTADAFVKVASARTPNEMRADTLTDGEMRVGTLLFDRDGVPVSVLDCLTAEGYEFDPDTGLVAKPGEAPHPLFWFGRLPRPEDYILTRSQETLEGILTDGEWEGGRSALIEGRLRQTMVGRVN